MPVCRKIGALAYGDPIRTAVRLSIRQGRAPRRRRLLDFVNSDHRRLPFPRTTSDRWRSGRGNCGLCPGLGLAHYTFERRVRTQTGNRNEDHAPRGGRFRNRQEAGRLLAAQLAPYRRANAVVLGLPRGGVPPAAEIARALELPLDVIISRKLGAPDNPEFAIGALAEGGDAYANTEGVQVTGALQSYVSGIARQQRKEIAHRQRLFRGGAPLRVPPHATVILVDDGIATGSTVIAAIQALRRGGVRRIVLAVPVAPPDTVERLRPMVDELVVLLTPPLFWAVGAFYEDFKQVSDDDVCRLLTEAARVRQNRSGANGVSAAGS
jgi:putative phosphoribosyl transferase